MARAWSTRKRVHRDLFPDPGNPLRGRDIRRTKRLARKRARARDLPLPKLSGAYTRGTHRKLKRIAEALGVHPKQLERRDERGRNILTRRAQRVIRHPATRTPAQLLRARQWKRNRQQAGGRKPKIINLRLTCHPIFGALGPELDLTGHHTAGPVDTSRQHAIGLCRSYHEQHRRQGWGGIGYHYCLARDGALLLLRPVWQKGAHVGGHNTSNVGVMCHGTTGDHPTPEQQETFRWLLANAHTSAMPTSHRTDRDLREARLHGHNDWSGHTSNACPGTHKRMFVSGGRER